MKICLSCHHHFKASDWTCPKCHFCPEANQGTLKLMIGDNTCEGFEAGFFEQLATLEDENFWFIARNQLIIWALENYLPDTKNFLEIGCGTGFVLSGISKAKPSLKTYASEFFKEGLDFAKARMPKTTLFQMDARNIPFAEEFDTIGAFDVIEHIQEDTQVLKEIHKALRPGGGLMLTVPLHQWMWSAQDDYAHHVRRYAVKELCDKAQGAGFEILRKTGFVSLLLPLMYTSRYFQSKDPKTLDASKELKLSKPINTLFKGIMALERTYIQLGGNFPVGGSMLLVAKKL